MYCPSCDKSYGAIHSRCPECHSWLKVSAPSSARSKATKSAAAPAPSSPAPAPSSNVSTLDRDSGASGGNGGGGIAWADPAPQGGGSSQWGGDSSSNDSWGGGSSQGGASATGAPSATPDGWSNGGSDSWGGHDSGASWGGQSAAAPTPRAESKPASNGWLGGDSQEADGWSTGGLSGGGSSQQPQPKAKSNGWLGGDSDQPSGGLGGGAAGGNSGGSGWLGDSGSSGGLGGGGGAAPSSSGGNGWLGDSAPAPSGQSQGWLGDSAPATSSGGGGGGESGWLDGSQPDSPSMSEMVDHAISVEDDDEFVDDSWVDEEIRDNEFDELEVPEYTPPAPEVGGAFLKMLLVAVLVVLVGGGVLFLRGDSKTPEELAAEKAEQRLVFGRNAVVEGQKDLEAGRAQLAIPQFREGLIALSEVEAPKEEIYEAEVLLAKALMGSEEYEEAIEHWRSLKTSDDEKAVAAATEGIQAAARELRATANEGLKEAKTYADKGEVNSVRRLGRDALDVYKSYGGSAAQKGQAYGIIGRAFLNGREYGNAQDYLKKAVKLAPGQGYEKYLKEASAQLKPTDYIAPMKTAPKRRKVVAKPTFDSGNSGYQTNTKRYRARPKKRTSSKGSAPAAKPKKKKKMKEIPIYRSNKRSAKKGPRKGRQGVLNSY